VRADLTLAGRRRGASLLADLGRELHHTRLLPGLGAGLAVGTVAAMMSVSFAALIFSEELTPFLGYGIGIALLSAVVIGIATTVGSSYPGTIAIPQNRTAPLLALMAAALTHHILPAAPACERCWIEREGAGRRLHYQAWWIRPLEHSLTSQRCADGMPKDIADAVFFPCNRRSGRDGVPAGAMEENQENLT
jgi:hypothetical protein